MSLQRGINFRSLAEKMGNCSGAEVRGICTEAGKLSLPKLSMTASSTAGDMGVLELTKRYVRPARTPAIRRSGRFRDGRRQGAQEELGEQHERQQAVQLDYWVCMNRSGVKVAKRDRDACVSTKSAGIRRHSILTDIRILRSDARKQPI